MQLRLWRQFAGRAGGPQPKIALGALQSRRQEQNLAWQHEREGEKAGKWFPTRNIYKYCHAFILQNILSNEKRAREVSGLPVLGSKGRQTQLFVPLLIRSLGKSGSQFQCRFWGLPECLAKV